MMKGVVLMKTIKAVILYLLIAQLCLFVSFNSEVCKM